MMAGARATAIIAIGTAIVSALILLTGRLPYAAVEAGFIPVRASGMVAHAFLVPLLLTPLTATLVHGGIAHLGFNLVMLVYCGQQAERATGATGLAILYVVGAYAAAAAQYAFDPSSLSPMIGASGAISAVVAAYALLYGERRAQAIGPIPGGVVHVAWLAAAWIGIQLLIGYAGFGEGAGTGPIAIGAHIGGFVAGLALARPLLLWRYRHA
ncbi:rhomboid family intramembrane serine protease [Sphingomonas sp. CROZ-RG-20F-R02-07]|uniref:rhomboid family intramembrane serine protease n=1 Tax=Sphingomonas sp. CROZ-RG-20F-R02-07 TaxID=2914832 RepID=UPI001F58C1A6|nr:rhomboid family intramembrane serine protease [Sphingomonas sp. CROZ-RG-20F-R02-07]